jgi:hypothetical protein
MKRFARLPMVIVSEWERWTGGAATGLPHPITHLPRETTTTCGKSVASVQDKALHEASPKPDIEHKPRTGKQSKPVRIKRILRQRQQGQVVSIDNVTGGRVRKTGRGQVGSRGRAGGCRLSFDAQPPAPAVRASDQGRCRRRRLRLGVKRVASGVVFGQRSTTWKASYPKTTPDPRFRRFHQEIPGRVPVFSWEIGDPGLRPWNWRGSAFCT